MDVEIKIGFPIRSNRGKPFENSHFVISDYETAIYLGIKDNSERIFKGLNHETVHALLNEMFNKTVAAQFDADFLFRDKSDAQYGEQGEPMAIFDDAYIKQLKKQRWHSKTPIFLNRLHLKEQLDIEA